MLSKQKVWIAGLLFFFFCITGGFTVYLKDGSSHEVSRVEFKGTKADLVTSNGTIISVSRNAIDYNASGILEPNGDGMVAQVPASGGTVPAPARLKPSPAGASTEELAALWETGKPAVAQSDFGIIHKGDDVRIITKDSGASTVIVRGADGTYRRTYMDEGTVGSVFPDFGKVKPSEAPASLPVIPREEAPPVPETPKSTFPSFAKQTPQSNQGEDVSRPEKTNRPPGGQSVWMLAGRNFFIVLGCGAFLLLVSVILYTRDSSQLRSIGKQLFLIAIGATLLFGYREGTRYYYRDKAWGRVKSVLDHCKQEVTVDAQTSISMWYAGVVLIDDRATLEKAWSLYEEWVKVHDLYHVKHWEFVSIELDPSDGKSSYVTMNFDGDDAVMYVKDMTPISWVEK